MTISSPQQPPRIKREPSTADSPSFFVSAFQTPKAGERRNSSCGGSGAWSTSRIERRAHVKQLKQCWKGGVGTPIVSGKGGSRRSLGGLAGARKRRWVEESEESEESEERDELCF